MTKLLSSLIAAALLGPLLAAAQTTGTSLPQQVSQLAPQLIAFAGGKFNFESLVNGLAFGAPVTLVTALPNGQLQTVSFAPQGTMSATQIAQALETTRQSLISRGIAVPNGQQMAVALAGGTLPTQTGNVQVTGTLPAVNLPATAAAGGTAPAPGAVTITTTPAAVAPVPGTISNTPSTTEPARQGGDRPGPLAPPPAASGTTAAPAPASGSSGSAPSGR